jgi:hypothetical protein
MSRISRRTLHIEKVASESDPETAFHCRDYAAHLRTLAEIVRQDMLEKQVQALDNRSAARDLAQAIADAPAPDMKGRA